MKLVGETQFASYFKLVNRWTMEIQRLDLPDDIVYAIRLLGDPKKFHTPSLAPLAVNKSDNMVAASITDYYEAHGKYFLLPSTTKGTVHESIEALIDIALQRSAESKPT